MGRRCAPYKRFASGKTLAQGQFTCPEHVQSHRGPHTACCMGNLPHPQNRGQRGLLKNKQKISLIRGRFFVHRGCGLLQRRRRGASRSARSARQVSACPAGAPFLWRNGEKSRGERGSLPLDPFSLVVGNLLGFVFFCVWVGFGSLIVTPVKSAPTGWARMEWAGTLQ